MSAVLTTPAVQKRTPICTSALMQIFDVPYSRLFDAEVILPNGDTKQIPNIRAYTAQISVKPNGFIELEIKSKDKEIGNITVRYPYHFTSGVVLCALKLNQHRTTDSFALNYDLFAMEWETFMLIHEINDVPYVYVTSRDEWEKNGEVRSENREVQVFLPTVNFQRFGVVTMKSIVSPSFINWIDDSVAECKRKRK